MLAFGNRGAILMRGGPGIMLSHPRTMFAGAFLTLAAAYIIGFNFSVRLDVDAAESRYEILQDAGRARAAAVYGERVLKMRTTEGVSSESLAPWKASLAQTYIKARSFDRAAELYQDALSTRWADDLSSLERGVMEEHLARSLIVGGRVEQAVFIFSDFLELSGDEATGHNHGASDSIAAFYVDATANAARLFSEALKPVGDPDQFTGANEARLAAAKGMTSLGGFYATRDNGLYAAAGLLASSYAIRREVLGGDHQDTVQAALMLGPVYRRMGRLGDAETLYLEAFHAQEKTKGANSPDLSLYIKLLAGVYEEQGRATEAQALYEHMRSLFRDAFGAQRYAINRARDRNLDVDRPVSQQFLLDKQYAPKDLTRAAEFSVPLSKNADLDEMKLRLAADLDEGTDAREANLPVRLAQLLSLCRSETNERLSLRSGYRSFSTQNILYGRLGYKGTVTPPGMSEHQLGLAADIDVNGRLMRQSDKSYQCFEENAFRYGFILSYPPGNNYLPSEDSFEPWHWRYVGIQTAQLYREAGPLNKPQEFLAALPCYQARAASGSFAPIGEPDVCLTDLEGDDEDTRLANGDNVNKKAEALPTPSNIDTRKLKNAHDHTRH